MSRSTSKTNEPLVVVRVHENAVRDAMKKRGIQDLKLHQELVVEKLKRNASRYVDQSVDDAGKHMEERN